jgi:uncharacterized membrane protein
VTLPGFILIALISVNLNRGWILENWGYVPSAFLGWLAWPLALLWHFGALKMQQRWFADSVLKLGHIIGFWFFLLLASRECQWQLGHLGDTWSSWSLLGWAIIPALVLWALQTRAVQKVWPISQYKSSYIDIGALPVAIGLFIWIWAANTFSPGNANPLPYVPILNPLELMLWLTLFALILWWISLPTDAPARLIKPTHGRILIEVTGFAIITATVLRTCHHFVGIDWSFDALYASRLTQAALSITWAICGVSAMILGHAWKRRSIWIGGATLMGVVVIKLFFIELADHGGLFRIVAFIGVGILLLIVGYFAPVPPSVTNEKNDTNERNSDKTSI